MKIVVGSLFFYPDHSGIALYASDFAFFAAQQGHEVKVVTGFPFYPSWKKSKEDRRVLFRKDKQGDVTIYRGYLYVPQNPTGFRRILQEITFIISATINFFRAGKSDAIVVFTTPVSLGLIGALFRKLFSSVLVINIQDFQVEAADSLGMLGKLPIVPLMTSLEKFSYRQADAVATISEGMIGLVKEKGIGDDKIVLWPNWIEVKKSSVLPPKGTFRQKYDIAENRTIIAYAGNVGAKQGLETLIDLAYQNQANHELIFLIIGEGGDLQNLKNYHQTHFSTNLRFLPFLDQKGYQEFLADADVIFVSQKKIPKDIYFPSKLLGIMAASKLIFLTADKESELYKVLKKNELSLVSEFGSQTEMDQCMKKITSSDPILDQYRSNAKKFVEQYDRQAVLSSVLNKIETLTK
jgi:colanic acid biosynthesis glycosyl transferase WcaI